MIAISRCDFPASEWEEKDIIELAPNGKIPPLILGIVPDSGTSGH